MNEEGIRFFRYVLPGLVFFIETLLFAYIVLPEQTVCFLNDHFQELGAVAAVLLASGGLGFIFASIHHFVHWQPCFSRFEKGIFDHRKVIKKLHDSQLIDPIIWGEISNCPHQTKAKMKALKHSQSLWYKLLKPRRAGKVAIDNLGHRAQGLGAARIASVFAFFSAIFLSMRYGTPTFEPCAIARTLLMLFIGIFAIYMFHTGYRRIAKLAHSQYTITLCKEADVRKKRITEAAYLRSVSRESIPGHEFDDWLAAEAEIDK